MSELLPEGENKNYKHLKLGRKTYGKIIGFNSVLNMFANEHCKDMRVNTSPSYIEQMMIFFFEWIFVGAAQRLHDGAMESGIGYNIYLYFWNCILKYVFNVQLNEYASGCVCGCVHS